jgi:uncharacterized membrane protein YagU involved in acid resistance
MTERNARWVRWLIIGWLIAGTFDITYASTYTYLRRGISPVRVWQSVASGALGPAAFQGGMRTAMIGLAFHYLIALIFTCVFFAASAVWPALTRWPLLTGAVYGIGIYVVMNFVVLPLSRIGPRPLPPLIVTAPEILVHMFLIGGTIALAARRAHTA